MERDNVIAQGAPYVLKDRLFDNSDKFSCYVCDICGQIAIYKKMDGYVIAQCKSCPNSKPISIQIPYATKLLCQQLIAINMIPRLIPDLEDQKTITSSKGINKGKEEI